MKEDAASNSQNSTDIECIFCSHSFATIALEIDDNVKERRKGPFRQNAGICNKEVHYCGVGITELKRFLEFLNLSKLEQDVVSTLAQSICPPCQAIVNKILASREEATEEKEKIKRLQQQLIESMRKLGDSVGQLQTELEGMQERFPLLENVCQMGVSDIKGKIKIVTRSLSACQQDLSSRFSNDSFGQKLSLLDDTLKHSLTSTSSTKQYLTDSSVQFPRDRQTSRPSPTPFTPVKGRNQRKKSESDAESLIDSREVPKVSEEKIGSSQNMQENKTDVKSNRGPAVKQTVSVKVDRAECEPLQTTLKMVHNPLRTPDNKKSDSKSNSSGKKNKEPTEVGGAPVCNPRQQLNFTPRISTRTRAKRERTSTENQLPSSVRKQLIRHAATLTLVKNKIPPKYSGDLKLNMMSHVKLVKMTPETLKAVSIRSSQLQPVDDLEKTGSSNNDDDAATTATQSTSHKGVKTKVIFFGGSSDEDDDDYDDDDDDDSSSSAESLDSIREYISKNSIISKWKRKVMLRLWGSNKYRIEEMKRQGVEVKYKFEYNKISHTLTYGNVAIKFNQKDGTLGCSKCKRSYQTSRNESLFFNEITDHILKQHLLNTDGSTTSSSKNKKREKQERGRQWNPNWDEDENNNSAEEEDEKKGQHTSDTRVNDTTTRPKRTKKLPPRYVYEQNLVERHQPNELEEDHEDPEEKEGSGAEEWMPTLSEEVVKDPRKEKRVNHKAREIGAQPKHGRPKRAKLTRKASPEDSQSNTAPSTSTRGQKMAITCKELQAKLFAKIQEWNESKEGNKTLQLVKKNPSLPMAQTAVAICTFNRSSADMWVLGTPIILQGSSTAPSLKCSLCSQTYDVFQAAAEEPSGNTDDGHRKIILHVLGEHLKAFQCLSCGNLLSSPLALDLHMKLAHQQNFPVKSKVALSLNTGGLNSHWKNTADQKENEIGSEQQKNGSNLPSKVAPPVADEETEDNDKTDDPIRSGSATKWDFKRGQKISLKGMERSKECTNSSESSDEVESELESV